MPKFIVELWLDGYEAKEQEEACRKFIKEQLDFTASSVKIENYPEPTAKEGDHGKNN